MPSLWDIEIEFQGNPLDSKLCEGKYQVGLRQLAGKYLIMNVVLCGIITEQRLPRWHPSTM